MFYVCFFFNDTATTEIYTLSLHDALPISASVAAERARIPFLESDGTPRPLQRLELDLLEEVNRAHLARSGPDQALEGRSEEHTSELQSRQYLVCRLLLEKKKHT